jgi:hypothetical protein
MQQADWVAAENRRFTSYPGGQAGIDAHTAKRE